MLVVLVVKDAERWLRDCLRGLAQQTYPRLGVIAVDNGSTDASRELLIRALGQGRVITLPENPGLPAAVQAALAMEPAQGADYVLIHHDDAALDPEAITRMVEVAERIDAVGVVGPKVVDWDDPQILREVGLSTDRFGYPYSPLEQDEIDQGQYDRVREVLFVSSSAMLVSRAALERTGLPDERFSSFHEDLDFCWRARLAGFRVVMTPLARARHRSAGTRGERSRLRRERARFDAERSSLAAMLKNYGLLSLLWILPLYVAQGVAKVALWGLERRFGEATQVLAAWGWNLLHLPGTIRRRARAQSVRAVPDRSVRRYMAPATVRLRRWAELASSSVLGRGESLAPEELEELEELEEPPPFLRRMLSLARAHPVATAWLLGVIVAAFAYRHLYGGAPLQGGALAAVPASPSDYFRELLGSTRTTALGGTQGASPALGFLGLLSAVLGSSTRVAQKALLFLLPPAAAYAFYRAALREAAERVPAVVGAACYGLSPLAFWAFSQGRIPVLVLMAVLPIAATRIDMAFATPGLHPRRFVAATAIVLAAGVAFDPGVALAVALLFIGRLAIRERGDRTGRGVGLLVAAGIGALLLSLPLGWDLITRGGRDLTSFAGRPSFTSLVRLVPGPGTGSWSVAWFLPLAALLGFTLADRSLRAAARYLGLALTGVYLAWASAAGLLPSAASNPSAYLAVAALSYSSLVVIGLASALPRMGREAFGFRQLAVVAVGAMLVGGLGLQAALAAKGGWDIGPNRLPPAWSLVDPVGHGSRYRVLWLGRLSGDPFVSPGGDPAATLRIGDERLRYSVTERTGAATLDTGRAERGPGYDALEGVLADIVTGATDHAGALLAPFDIRYVVATKGDLTPAVRRRLGQQVDLDEVPTIGLTIFRDDRSLPEAAAVTAAQYASPRLSSAGAAAPLPPQDAELIPARPGGSFSGPLQSSGTVLLADQYDDGWRLVQTGHDVAPQRVFGWSMRFTGVEAGGARLVPPSQTPRRIEIVILAILWFAALWITRRPATR